MLTFLFLDGQIYAGGEWNYNQLNETSRMKYDTTNRQYCNTVFTQTGRLQLSVLVFAKKWFKSKYKTGRRQPLANRKRICHLCLSSALAGKVR